MEHWTGGRYKLAPSPYSRIFTLAIPLGREKKWKEYLAHHGVSSARHKRVGGRVELIPTVRLKSSRVRGEPVIPRKDVERLIRDHPALYGDAEELMLDRP